METAPTAEAKSSNFAVARLDPPPIPFLHRTSNVEASFSSYLKPQNEAAGGEPAEDTEISVFDAKKYFGEGIMMKEAELQPGKGYGSLHGYSPATSASESSNYSRSGVRRNRSFKAATISSEASWNSRTGLLANPPQGNLPSSGKTSASKGSASRWSFGQRCACFCKKSVQISQPKTTISSNTHVKNHPATSVCTLRLEDPRREISADVAPRKQLVPPGRLFSPPRALNASKDRGHAGFAFPVLTPSSAVGAVAPSRDFFDMFEQRRNRCVVFPNNPRWGTKDGFVVDEETASDGSSDLFEIESFSTQAASSHPLNYPSSTTRRRDDLIDEVCTECGYEPSEASIAWSVNTAETASVANYREAGAEAVRGGSRRRGGNGLLISCRGHKAVMVGVAPTADKSLGLRRERQLSAGRPLD